MDNRETMRETCYKSTPFTPATKSRIFACNNSSCYGPTMSSDSKQNLSYPYVIQLDPNQFIVGSTYEACRISTWQNCALVGLTVFSYKFNNGTASVKVADLSLPLGLSYQQVEAGNTPFVNSTGILSVMVTTSSNFEPTDRSTVLTIYCTPPGANQLNEVNQISPVSV